MINKDNQEIVILMILIVFLMAGLSFSAIDVHRQECESRSPEHVYEGLECKVYKHANKEQKQAQKARDALPATKG